MLVTLGFSVPDAMRERRALIAARLRGEFTEDVRLYVANAGRRREIIRLFKHAVIITGILISFSGLPTERAIVLRNCAFAAVATLMLINTLLDHRMRRRVMREADCD